MSPLAQDFSCYDWNFLVTVNFARFCEGIILDEVYGEGCGVLVKFLELVVDLESSSRIL